MNVSIPLATLAAFALSALPADASPPPGWGQDSGLVRVAPTDDAPYLGIYISDSEAGGVQVTQVIDGTPAARAGLQAGDRIVSLGKAKVEDVGDLFDVLGDLRPGDALEVVLRRGDGGHTLEVVLGSRGEAPGGVFEPVPEPREHLFFEELEEQEDDAAADRRRAFEGEWRALVERQDAAMDRWAAEFEDRMAEMREHMESRWRGIVRELDAFEEEHADGVGEGVREALRRHVGRFRETLERDRAERGEHLDGLQARMGEMARRARERMRRLRDGFSRSLRTEPSSRFRWTDVDGEFRVDLQGPDGERRTWRYVLEDDDEDGEPRSLRRFGPLPFPRDTGPSSAERRGELDDLRERIQRLGKAIEELRRELRERDEHR